MKTKTRIAIQVGLRALMLMGLAAATASSLSGDAREIVRRVAAADDRNWNVARNDGFRSGWTRRFDSQGRLKSRDVTI